MISLSPMGMEIKGKDIADARDRAYEAVELIRWDGVHYRRDIGGKALTSQD